MSSSQLISKNLLLKSDKILFVASLAIGDFVYLQTCFALFKKQYPHLAIDLWIDEGRQKAFSWGRIKKTHNEVLYDWVESTGIFRTVYKNTNETDIFEQSFKAVRQENYPIVVSVGWVRSFRHAVFARSLSPNGFIAGLKYPTKFYNLIQKYKYSFFDAAHVVDPVGDYKDTHISDIMQSWFTSWFGMQVADDEKAPFINIPAGWDEYATNYLQQAGLNKGDGKRLVFINSFSRDVKRSWPISNIIGVIQGLQEQHPRQFLFIVNSLPHKYKEIKQAIDQANISDSLVFTANKSFFQLPSVLAMCNLVISVETSIMHIAAALKVPVLALMRQKNPEWAPFGKNDVYVMMTDERSDWVDKISPELVIKQVQEIIS